MNKKFKLVLICLCSAAVLFGVIVGITYIPRSIQKDLSGVELLMKGPGDSDELLQKVDIHINGSIHNGMFMEDPYFKGRFEVSEYPYTLNNDAIVSETVVSLYSGSLIYNYLDIRGGADNGGFVFGFLYTNKDFSSIAIHIYDEIKDNGSSSSYSLSNRVIVAPAKDVKTAHEVLTSNVDWFLKIYGMSR